MFDLQTRDGGFGYFSEFPRKAPCRSPESLIFHSADVCVLKHLAGWRRSMALIASRVSIELAGLFGLDVPTAGDSRGCIQPIQRILIKVDQSMDS